MTAPGLAVVTGASRGIGAATARALAAAGWHVVLLARGAAALRDVAAAIGDAARPIPCDLADGAAVHAAVERLLADAGVPALLVNNAGLFPLGAVGELPLAEAERSLAVNLLAPYRLLHLLLPAMREAGRGHVVTIGSIADRHAFPGNGAYAAGKFGARALHEVVRLEVQGTPLRASLVSPGPVDTPIWDPIDPDHRPGFTPRARMLAPEAVADAVCWVASRPADVNIDELRLTHR